MLVHTQYITILGDKIIITGNLHPFAIDSMAPTVTHKELQDMDTLHLHYG